MTTGEAIDQAWFRQVLGQYPTGVSVVTAKAADGTRVGFVVGSFTSVSLDPPLVAFLPAKASNTWRQMEGLGSFCVNVLGAEQEEVCRAFASKRDDKFDGVEHREAPSGSPIIDGVVAWIDCDVESVTEAGDHYIVVGRVRHLDVEAPSLPLLFFQGGYGRFSPHSMAAGDPRGLLTEQLREVDLVRTEMESLVRDIPGSRCNAVALLGEELVVLASARGTGATGPATIVGQHLPFVPPFGTALAAWMDDASTDRWLDRLTQDHAKEKYRQDLESARLHGFSVGLQGDAQRELEALMDRLAEDPSAWEPDVLDQWILELEGEPAELTAEAKASIAAVSVPVFRGDRRVAMMLTVHGFDGSMTAQDADIYLERTLLASRRASQMLGAEPGPADPSQ
jgi:flavin reductase (DIM6/NTAB) family NADH-FMN oxidoreductase RutF/DNA-binding IclR family transcriptional regulator